MASTLKLKLLVKRKDICNGKISSLLYLETILKIQTNEEIIYEELDIKMWPFMRDELVTVLRTIKNM